MIKKRPQKARRPTFKVYCDLAFVAEALVAVVALAGWWRGLQDAPQILQDDAIAFAATIIAYTMKSGFEHSKWATPQQAAEHLISDHPVATAALSGLVSSGGDLSVAASDAINAAQTQAEQDIASEIPQDIQPMDKSTIDQSMIDPETKAP